MMAWNVILSLLPKPIHHLFIAPELTKGWHMPKGTNSAFDGFARDGT
jgi:hypothetical protein